ncbi:hypothetical protein [Streptomyces sp. NPDC023838]|uniref:hypothetical protein n=1 Tax=Streptomyces sp. NPDC023838 TaxID=3154325 RepID=UPI00340E6C2E
MALLTLAEAKAQLDIQTTADDVELLAYIESLTAVIENLVGPVEPRTVTETIHGNGSTTMVLGQRPVLSLTSLTPILSAGLPLDVAALALDPGTGELSRLDGRYFGGGPWTVTYQAGRADIPATINVAARILLQHLWRTQYGASRALGGVGGGDDYSVNEPVPGWGYAVPNRVLQLLEPYKLPPAVA